MKTPPHLKTHSEIWKHSGYEILIIDCCLTNNSSVLRLLFTMNMFPTSNWFGKNLLFGSQET